MKRPKLWYALFVITVRLGVPVRCFLQALLELRKKSEAGVAAALQHVAAAQALLDGIAPATAAAGAGAAAAAAGAEAPGFVEGAARHLMAPVPPRAVTVGACLTPDLTPHWGHARVRAQSLGHQPWPLLPAAPLMRHPFMHISPAAAQPRRRVDPPAPPAAASARRPGSQGRARVGVGFGAGGWWRVKINCCSSSFSPTGSFPLLRDAPSPSSARTFPSHTCTCIHASPQVPVAAAARGALRSAQGRGGCALSSTLPDCGQGLGCGGCHCKHSAHRWARVRVVGGRLRRGWERVATASTALTGGCAT